MKDEKHPGWKGDEAGYGALHSWIYRKLGRPETCMDCGKTGLKGSKIHWANVDHEYRRILEDWIRLCVQCHVDHDKQLV